MMEKFILAGVPLKSEGAEDWLRKRVFDLSDGPIAPSESRVTRGLAARTYLTLSGSTRLSEGEPRMRLLGSPPRNLTCLIMGL
jgi:hypothetical protein